jgi:uncharacterized protein YjbJ (UPF0337 family)
MSTSSMSTSSSTDQLGGSANGQGSTKDQAAEQAKHVAGVASEEAKSVAGDVRDQARGLLDETKTQVQDQSRTQRDRLVETLRTFSDDLDGMAEQRDGMASGAAREVANRARSLSQQLDGREPTELLDDLRSFARRRPGMFLAGSLIAGVVAGRFLRGSRDAAQGGSTNGADYDATVTQDRPVTPVTDPYMTGATSTGTFDEPTGTPGAYPPVTPAVTSTEPDRPFGAS